MSFVNEYVVAKEKVLPHLVSDLKWPEKLISPYGRVPVEVGTQTVWADFVCYIFKNQNFIPWLLVEVKKDKKGLDTDAVAQAESYSLILDCPFFCVTDGKEYQYFMAGARQGERTEIAHLPIPDSKYLQRGLGEITFSTDIEPFIESFVSAHIHDRKFREDTEWHEQASKEIRRKIFNRNIDSLSQDEFKEVLEKHIMAKDINRDALLQNDLRKIRSVMKFIRDFKKYDDPLIGINRLIQNSSVQEENLHLDGGGLFFVTQLLAAAYPKDYVALERNVAEALRELGITSIFVQPNTANGYLFINDVCKKLYREKILPALEKAGLKYGHWAVHNFLWHYNAYYKVTKSSWTNKK